MSQDEYGVVFLARNKESGEPLSVRRVFPNGPDGPGIEGDDKRVFLATMARLATLRHHLLRPILDGGVDPVDNMPYVIMPVMAGTVLSEELAGNAADATVTKTLLDEALEASEILSGLLGEESVWVETAPTSILIGDPDEGRAFFFRISIGKWIIHREDRHDFSSLAELAETMLGWKTEEVTPELAGNLGEWVLHIRRGGFATLGEARRALRQVGRVQKKVTAKAATFKPGGATTSSVAADSSGPAVYTPTGRVGAATPTPTASATTPAVPGSPRAATVGGGRPPGPAAATRAGGAAASAPRTYVAPPAAKKGGAKMWVMAGVVMLITAVLAVALVQKLKSQKAGAQKQNEAKSIEQITKENAEAAKMKALIEGSGKKDAPKK